MAKKILVVEDDFESRYLLSLVLKNEGFEVLTARDGESALAVAARNKLDLIITDVNMPLMNGIELTEKIKNKPDTASVPILGMTAYGPSTMQNMILAGAAACAKKPIVLEEFLPAVKMLLA